MGDQRNGGIAWCDETWNPIRGCSRVSAGCVHCYAESVAARFRGKGLPYEGLTSIHANGERRWNGKIMVVEKHIDDPLRWQRPRKVFVNSMSDLFHENVPDEVIDRIFNVMFLATQHTFQVLTKRPERMLRYVMARDLKNHPIRNVWLGVSVEDQVAADERIPLLLQTPAAVRFLSVEPQLEQVDLRSFLVGHEEAGTPFDGAPHVGGRIGWTPPINWVIAGGESGAYARPFAVEWARAIRDECKAAGVVFFMKQMGANVRWGGTSQPGQHWPAGTKMMDTGRGDFRVMLKDRAGADPEEWPEDLRVQEFPTATKSDQGDHGEAPRGEDEKRPPLPTPAWSSRASGRR